MHVARGWMATDVTRPFRQYPGQSSCSCVCRGGRSHVGGGGGMTCQVAGAPRLPPPSKACAHPHPLPHLALEGPDVHRAILAAADEVAVRGPKADGADAAGQRPRVARHAANRRRRAALPAVQLRLPLVARDRQHLVVVAEGQGVHVRALVDLERAPRVDRRPELDDRAARRRHDLLQAPRGAHGWWWWAWGGGGESLGVGWQQGGVGPAHTTRLLSSR
jgi:hypothetical protein